MLMNKITLCPKCAYTKHIKIYITMGWMHVVSVTWCNTEGGHLSVVLLRRLLVRWWGYWASHKRFHWLLSLVISAASLGFCHTTLRCSAPFHSIPVRSGGPVRGTPALWPRSQHGPLHFSKKDSAVYLDMCYSSECTSRRVSECGA